MNEPHQYEPPPARRERFDLGAAIAGLVFVVLGVLFMIDALDLANIDRDVVWPAVVIALGAALVLSAAWNRRS